MQLAGCPKIVSHATFNKCGHFLQIGIIIGAKGIIHFHRDVTALNDQKQLFALLLNLDQELI
ncbi:hypothetical protein D3C75_1082980 [compost metagenome]